MEITPEQHRSLLMQAILVGPARAMNLLSRVPALFAKRGWESGGDCVVVAAIAVGLVKVGVVGTVLKKPPGANSIAKWATMADKFTAKELVEQLELQELLSPS